ncbi:TIGR03617 family F420-dependent LLM class oxidoreductase [Spirillospora sp. NPDC048911]|uniref:TIGR03617 family F420-dependent LLM class oxidoreductase n=1 Tax=Spirillospora sp. NPDC048911 TaxID=3364527 RepID=UPI003711A03E
MKVDVAVGGPELRQISVLARLAEDIGFDCLYTAESCHDPFPPLARAAEHTTRIGLGTSIAVALARSPMTLAHLANDLQEYSRGRFTLGLGAQTRAHPGRQYRTSFQPPVARMRELIGEIRGIWRSWQDQSHTDQPRQDQPRQGQAIQSWRRRNQPLFALPAHPFGPPRIHLAGVGPRMTQLAGELADGLILHGFTTARHLRETTVPALERGLRHSGRSWDDIEVVAPAFLITGATSEAYERSERQTRTAIALYGANPAYRRVLESAGRPGLQDELALLARHGRWQQMPGLIDDDLLDEVAVRGEPVRIPELLVRRYGALCRRVTLMGPFHQDPGTWAALVARIHEITCEPVPS